MAKRTPTVEETVLTGWDEYKDERFKILDIVEDWELWQDWLNSEVVKVFRYVGNDGTSCTMMQEMRRQFGDNRKMKPTWYAHKRLGGKLKRRYLGKPENLSYEKLKQVTFEVCQRELVNTST